MVLSTALPVDGAWRGEPESVLWSFPDSRIPPGAGCSVFGWPDPPGPSDLPFRPEASRKVVVTLRLQADVALRPIQPRLNEEPIQEAEGAWRTRGGRVEVALVPLGVHRGQLLPEWCGQCRLERLRVANYNSPLR